MSKFFKYLVKIIYIYFFLSSSRNYKIHKMITIWQFNKPECKLILSYLVTISNHIAILITNLILKITNNQNKIIMFTSLNFIYFS